MRYLHRLIPAAGLALLLLAAGALALAASSAREEPRPAAGIDAPLAPGRVIVAVPPGTGRDAVVTLLARQGASLGRWLPRLGIALALVPEGREVAAAQALDAEPDVDFAIEDRLVAYVADTPLDQHWDKQWGPLKAGAPAAWDAAWGDPGVVVAILDTGVYQSHADLSDRTWRNPGESAVDPATGERTCNAWIACNNVDDDDNGYIDDCRGYDFVNSDNNPAAEVGTRGGHGTAVAGIAAASTNNPSTLTPGVYEGIAGMARGAFLMAARVMNQNGEGSPADIAAGIDYAAGEGAQVINLSLTFPANTPPDSPYLEVIKRAIAAAQAAGSLVVAASGNEGYNGVSFPASYPGVLAVGASTRADAKASFSNYGPRLDLVAPGEGIYSTLYSGMRAYGYYNSTGSGTSFATPHVAGVAALVRGLRPDLDQAAVHALLRQAADDVNEPGFDPQTGWGRLNAARAISTAASALRLSLAADPPTVATGGATALRLRVTAPNGAPAGLGGRVSVTGTLGSVSQPIVTLDGLGQAGLAFVAGPETGISTITATLGPVSATLPLTVTSGLPAALSLQAAAEIVASGGGTVAITATVRDEGGSAVHDGTEVAFAASLGAASPATVATVEGRAVTVFTAGPISGTAAITAAVGGLQAHTTLEIVGAGEPYRILLTADPAALRVDEADAAIVATVTDAFGAAVADGVRVYFATDRGALSAAEALTAGGQAVVRLAPGTLPGPAVIRATAGRAAGQMTVPILPGLATTIGVTADPSMLTAGYGQLSRIRAAAADRYGNPVADGTVLSFSASLGRLTAPAASTVDGFAEVDLAGELVAGTSTVTVSAAGGAQGTVTVTIKPAAAASLEASADPGAIAVGGEISRITAIVQDAYGNAVADGTLVGFTTDLGQWLPAGGSETQRSVATAGGTAVITLASGEASGTAHVQVRVSPSLAQALTVAFRPGPAGAITLTVDPAQVRAGRTAQVTAWVTDRFGNPVADGSPVTFGANQGRFLQTEAPTANGLAAAWYVAAGPPGPTQIVAVCGGVLAFKPVQVLQAKMYLPAVLRR